MFRGIQATWYNICNIDITKKTFMQIIRLSQDTLSREALCKLDQVVKNPNKHWLESSDFSEEQKKRKKPIL